MSDETLTDLYRQYAPVVYRRSRALLGDEEEALDAVHDIFLKLHQELSSFRGESALFTWIYRVTTNHCLNCLRGRKTRARAQEQLAQVAVKTDGGRASLTIERRDLIRHLLGQFDVRKVQIVVHCYYDEMTQNEVAALLGISDRAVRKTLAKVGHEVKALGLAMEKLQEAHE